MSTELDLDDVAAQSPLAMRELATLRSRTEILDAALQVVVDLGGEVRQPEIDEARALRRDAERYALAAAEVERLTVAEKAARQLPCWMCQREQRA